MSHALSRTNAARRRQRQGGNAIVETIVALLALSPFLVGIPLLGKQLDIKHKTYDAARYSIWERAVWRSDGTSNRKSAEDIALEARDRAIGDPRVGLLAVHDLRTQGITENRFWLDHARERLIDYERDQAAIDADLDERRTPVAVGYLLTPGLAHGDGPLSAAAELLRVEDLDLNRRAFASVVLSIGVRPVLSQLADTPRRLDTPAASSTDVAPLVLRAGGALLSDTWSAHDEEDFRRRVDYVTTNELLESLELPARPIGAMALGKGRLLYGEGQYAWAPELRPRSDALPAAYVGRR
jgi:hypothetical protein